MSAYASFTTARKTSRVDLVATWLNSGKILVYADTRPLTPNTAVADQVLLATFDFSATAGTTEDGVWTVGSISAAMVVATGIAAWARFIDSEDVTIMDVDVGVTGSASALELDSCSLAAGGYVSITSLTYSEN